MQKRHHAKDLPPRAPTGSLTANQVVAANLQLIRERQGLTQTQVADSLNEMTGKSYKKATISAMERSADGGKKRLFDAQELLEFSRFFGVPIFWFFIPLPEHLEQRLDVVGMEKGGNLIDFLFGDPDWARGLQQRLSEIIEDEEQPFLARHSADLALWNFAARRDAVAEAILADESAVEEKLDTLMLALGEFKAQLVEERSALKPQLHEPGRLQGMLQDEKQAGANQ